MLNAVWGTGNIVIKKREIVAVMETRVNGKCENMFISMKRHLPLRTPNIIKRKILNSMYLSFYYFNHSLNNQFATKISSS